MGEGALYISLSASKRSTTLLNRGYLNSKLNRKLEITDDRFKGGSEFIGGSISSSQVITQTVVSYRQDELNDIVRT